MGKKNKKKAMVQDWDLSYDEQMAQLNKFDEFIATGSNDMLVNNDNSEDNFEQHLFSMIRGRLVSPPDDVRSYNNDVIESSGDFSGEVINIVNMNDNDRKPELSFECDDSLQTIYINDGLERIGIPYDSKRFDTVDIANKKALSYAVIDYMISSMTPYAITDDINDILELLTLHGISHFDTNKFKIIYDELDTFYSLYIVDDESVASLSMNHGKSYDDYANMLIEFEERSRSDFDKSIFYDSKYNNFGGYFQIMSEDINTSKGEPLSLNELEDMILVVSDIQEVVEPVIDKYYGVSIEKSSDYYDEEDDDEDIDDTDDLVLDDEVLNQTVVKSEDSPIIEVGELRNSILNNTIKVEETVTTTTIVTSPVVESNDDSTITAPETEVEPEPIPEESEDDEIKDVNPDDLDFGDLGEIPVIRKPKKK